jgi:cytochrome c oxidase assembly factor CtaG
MYYVCIFTASFGRPSHPQALAVSVFSLTFASSPCLVSGTKTQTKMAMHMQKMANIKNVFQPMLLMAEGVILVMTKLKSHWVAAGERC